MKISNENSKLGKIPNISLIPVKDCAQCTGCGKRPRGAPKDWRAPCYALKSFRQYPNVRAAWSENSKAWRANVFAAAAEILNWFENRRTPPRFFRIHVAGDFLSQEHVAAWCVIASANPETRFLAFTKRHDLAFGVELENWPANFQVVFSQWPGQPATPAERGPRAWVAPGPRGFPATEPRIPADAIECPGFCESCGMCWNLADLGRDVFFREH